MPSVRENTGEVEIFRIGNNSWNLDRFSRMRLNADTMRAAIDLEKHVEFYTGVPSRSVQTFHRLRIVGQQVKFNATPEYPDRLSKFSRLDRDCISDVTETVPHERPRLGKRRNGDRTVMPRRLYPRHLHTLVRLDMRPQANIIAPRDCAHPLSVLSYATKINQ